MGQERLTLAACIGKEQQKKFTETCARMAANVNQVFESVQATFSSNEAVREAIRNARDQADLKVRQTHRSLGSLNTATDLQEAVKEIEGNLAQTGPLILAIQAQLPKEAGSFYRYNDLWRSQLQLISTIAVILEFVKNDNLADVEKVKKMSGADIQLPIEEYLFGVTRAVSDIARLCLTRVIKRDFEMPERCLKFGSNVFEGFKLLNLKNDHIRKSFDGMKYDIKKMEDILYDLSIRGLAGVKVKPTADGEGPIAKKAKLIQETPADSKTEAKEDVMTIA